MSITDINTAAMILLVIAVTYLFTVFTRAYRRRCSYAAAWSLYGILVIFLIALTRLLQWYAMK